MSLMTGSKSSYVVQKLISVLPSSELGELHQMILANLLPLSLDKVGCRVVQFLLEFSSSDQQTLITRCLAEEERCHGVRACTLTLGAVNTPLWDAESVQSDFDRRAMLTVDQAADALVNLAEQPSNQVIEDLTLMPAAGAF